MRGASALEEVLRAFPESPLHVFVVWEPVLMTDLGPPTTSTLARIHDARVTQCWDRDRHLSKDLIRAMLAEPKRYILTEEIHEDDIVWDTIALFPAGALWTSDVPVPAFYGHPVVDSMDGLHSALAGLPIDPRTPP